MSKVTGFDYVTGLPAASTLPAWRTRMAEALKDGGRRRVVNGETFVHDSRGVLLFEVYANVSDRGSQPPSSDLTR